MRLKYKLLLISILFLGFIIFNNSDCFAFTYEGQEVPDLPSNDYNSKYTYILRWGGNNSIYLFYVSNNALKATTNENECSVFGGENCKLLLYYNNCYIQVYSLSSSGSTWQQRAKGYLASNEFGRMAFAVTPDMYLIYSNNVFYYNNYGIIFENDETTFDKMSSIPSTGSIEDYYRSYLGSYEGIKIPFGNCEPDIDKINLYELNLTDLDYNNQEHLFNICTYTSSPCYNEIMDCYNNDYQYTIYLTQYARYLTYDNEENKNFQYGSYSLSGYIDYLVTDKSFFYFSPYHNKVLSNSGTMIFGKDVENYKKRFYFKLVYSDDSNSPNIEIWEDNGSLILGDVKDIAESDYFLGSSQTIYYADEKNNHDIKKLTDRVFYRGYLKRNDDDPVRNITNTPFYRYNFSFSGGVNSIFYLSDPDYNNKIDRLKYLLDVDYTDRTNFNNQYYNDEEYYIKGDDDSTATFTDKELNKDSSDKDFEDSRGEERHPTYNKEDDDTNWSILDFLRNIYYTLTGKNNPGSSSASNAINQTTDTVTSKFAFKDNIVNNANEIKDYITNTQETHKYYLNINHKYLSGNVCIIDLSWYEQYKPTVDAFICAFAYLAFIWHMFCNIPGLISGASAGSYIQDIEAYKHTGFARSSNIHIHRGGF